MMPPPITTTRARSGKVADAGVVSMTVSAEQAGLRGPAGTLALEVLAQRYLLPLVVRVQRIAVEPVRRLDHVLEAQLADVLPVLDRERDVVGADLERRPAAGERRDLRVVAEAGVEEAGVVRPELAARRGGGRDRGRVLRGDGHAVLGEQQVELLGVQ